MTWEVLLALESQVSYSLDFAQGVLRKLQGAGIVRWVETVQRSRRVGIEFTNLTEQTRNELLALLGETHPRSFIPKDCPVSRSAANALP